jgi:hypothetical protein
MALARAGADDPDGVASEEDVEGSGVLGVAIADEELGGHVVCQVHREVAGLLGHPAGSRLCGHAGDLYEPRVSWWMNTST